MKKEVLYNLQQKALDIRTKVLDNIYHNKRGHIGGTYSALDVFVYLYYGEWGLRFDPLNYRDHARDRFIIGKGHACLALYYIWLDKGMIKSEWIDNYGQNGNYLSGQLNIDTPGVEYNSGSLGHALGVAAGMAMAAKMDNNLYLSIAFIGDGECSEGSIWESIEFAGKSKLNNLICIVDYNRLGVTDFIGQKGEEEILQKRAKSFGWDCDIINGHDFEDIEYKFREARELKRPCERPLMLIAKTIKGKGISFMEDGIKWHHSIPSEEEYKKALQDLKRD